MASANFARKFDFDRRGEIDLRTRQLEELSGRIRKAGLSDEWNSWIQFLDLKNAPQAIFEISRNNDEAFGHVDAWTGTRHLELARLVSFLIQEHDLYTLDNPHQRTPRGASVGGQLGDNPLRGALAISKNHPKETVIALCLALLFVALIRDPKSVRRSWIDILGTAVHGHALGAWAVFFDRCNPPESVDSLEVAVSWARRFSGYVDAPNDQNKPRASDGKFITAIESLGKLLSGVPGRRPGGGHVAHPPSVTIRLETDIQETEGIPELAVRQVEYVPVEPAAWEEGEETESLLLADGDPEGEPEDQADEDVQESNCISTAFRSYRDNQRLRYSWGNLPPAEVRELVRAVEASLTTTSLEKTLASMFVGVSICTGTNPEKSVLMPISDGMTEGLDPIRGIYRKPVPRPPNGWKPPPGMKGPLLNKPAEMLEFPLPASIAGALKKRLSRKHAGMPLGKALGFTNRQARKLVREWLSKASGKQYKFSPRRIARILETQVFADTQRAVMCYWIAGSSVDPPPSSTYYSQASASDVERSYVAAIRSIWSFAGLEPEIQDISDERDDSVGSHLVPPAEEIQRLAEHLRSQIGILKASDHWEDVVHFHNRYTAYVTTLLMYATGHRPVTDPFDAHASISLLFKQALIDDKNLGRERTMRIVPLCDLAIRQIQLYQDHLRGLLAMVPDGCEAFGVKLAAQLEHRSARILPFLFFLDRERNWLSVSQASMSEFFPDMWGYTHRVHRHLLATWLLGKGVSEEASAQLLGHVDVGTASLSPVSPHAAKELFSETVDAIDAFMAFYGWTEVEGLNHPTSQGADRFRNKKKQKGIKRCIFGTEARMQERLKQEAADDATIERLIADRLDGRSESELNQQDIDYLLESIEAGQAKQSDRRAWTKKSKLRSRLKKAIRDNNLDIVLPKRRQIIAHEPSLFEPETLAEAERAKSLRELYLERLKEIRTPLSAKEYPALRAAYALAAFIMLARVLDVGVVKSIVKGMPFWLVEDDNDGYFLEVQVGEKNIRRFPVGVLAAVLLSGTSFSQETEPEVMHEFNKLIGELKGEDRRSKKDNILDLVTIFQHEARVDLPGYLYGYISGESGAASLPRHAWLRAKTGKHPIREKLPRLAGEEPKAVEEAVTYPDQDETLPRSEVGNSKRDARAFIKEMDKVVSAHWGRKVGKDGKTRARNTAPKGKIANEVEKLINQKMAERKLPGICYLLGRWFVNLCRHGSQKGEVKLSSAVTYLSSIKTSLAERAHDIHLSELRSETIGEIYSRVLDDAKVDKPEQILKRLQYFHAFLRQQFGAAELDWGEIIPEGMAMKGVVVDAGFITFGEYLVALDLLENDEFLPERDRLINCVTLLLTYRYGLRISEAAGIRRKDLIGEIENLVVRVCNDEFRKIKTDAGIRNVPTLIELNEKERSIIGRWIEHIDHCHGDDRLAGLFSEEEASRTLVSQWKIASRVTDALVVATGDPNARIHYCRHSFGSSNATALLPDGIAGANTQFRASLGLLSPTSEANIRRKLLDVDRQSRRGMWALAAVIGHAYPATTQHYYCHLHDMALRLTQGAMVDPEMSTDQLYILLGARLSLQARGEEGAIADAFILLKKKIKADRVEQCVTEPQQLTLPEPRFKQERKDDIDLPAVLRLLQAADKDARLENLSARLLLDPDKVFKVLQKARWVAGKAQYQTEGKGGDDLALPDPELLSPQEWGRLKKLAVTNRKISKLDQDAIEEAAKIWMVGYMPGTTPLLIREKKELNALLKLLSAVDVQKERIELRFDERMVENNWQKDFIRHAESSGVKQINPGPIPLYVGNEKTQAGRRRRLGFLVGEATSGPLRNMRVCHHLFFGLAVTGSLDW